MPRRKGENVPEVIPARRRRNNNPEIEQEAVVQGAPAAVALAEVVRQRQQQPLQPPAVVQDAPPPAVPAAAGRQRQPRQPPAVVQDAPPPAVPAAAGRQRPQYQPLAVVQDAPTPAVPAAAGRQRPPHQPFAADPAELGAPLHVNFIAEADEQYPPGLREEAGLIGFPRILNEVDQGNESSSSDDSNYRQFINERYERVNFAESNQRNNGQACNIDNGSRIFNSTRRENINRRNIESENQTSEDPYCNRFMNMMEQTLSVIRDTSMSQNNSSLLNRMTSAKSLASFSGDPLDWFRFKDAFEESTEKGNYSDKENVMRLYECLKGDARNAARMLFAGGNSATDIMKTLKMRFGNPKIIIAALLNEIRNLPRIELHKMSFVKFATDLKSAVSAIRALKQTGYLDNDDLKSEVLRKLPSSMLSNYIRYAKSVMDTSKTDLEKLADFLFEEVEMSLAAGIIEIHSSETTRSRTDRSNSHSLTNKATVLATNVSESNDIKANNSELLPKKTTKSQCAHCGRRNHSTDLCRDFAKVPIFQRWKVARVSRLCFNCLHEGHSCEDCKKARCKLCNKPHHELLHMNDEKKEKQAQQDTREVECTKSNDAGEDDGNSKS